MLIPLGVLRTFNGDRAAASLYDFAKVIAATSKDDGPNPHAGGALSIAGTSLGSYDLVCRVGNLSTSGFVSADWFTATADSRSAWVVVKGDLTIAGAFQPSARKLFTVVYVTGNLVVNGAISMTRRGANHSASGSNITAGPILIATGLHGGEMNPTIAAGGIDGGNAVTDGDNAGVAGRPGPTGPSTTPYRTAGGGSGSAYGSTANSGPGQPGTSFSGGTGGGSAEANGDVSGNAGATAGGAGGPASFDSLVPGAGGGAGNPGGASVGTGSAGQDGTGGVLIVIVEGNVSGSGTFEAKGADGGQDGWFALTGGASGGGIAVVFHRGSFSGPTFDTTTGNGGGSAGSAGHFSL